MRSLDWESHFWGNAVVSWEFVSTVAFSASSVVVPALAKVADGSASSVPAVESVGAFDAGSVSLFSTSYNCILDTAWRTWWAWWTWWTWWAWPRCRCCNITTVSSRGHSLSNSWGVCLSNSRYNCLSYYWNVLLLFCCLYINDWRVNLDVNSIFFVSGWSSIIMRIAWRTRWCLSINDVVCWSYNTFSNFESWSYSRNT